MQKAKQQTNRQLGYLNRQVYIKDPETGELIEAGNAMLYTESLERNKGFNMLWPKQFLKCKIFEVQFLLWLIYAQRGNYVIQTDQQLAMRFKCSRQRIERLKKKMKDDDLIKYRNGVIMLNPNLIWQGNVKHRTNAKAQYHVFDKEEFSEIE